MSKVPRIEQKLQLSFDSANYYEAHQIYRTLYHRMANQGKWSELQDLLFNGAMKLLDAKEPTSAIDLAELYVEALQKSNTPVTPTTLERFEQLFSRLPSTLNKDTTTPDGQQTDRRMRFLNLGVKWSMAVGKTKREREKGHPDFHRMIGKTFWKEENYLGARSHFMLSDDAETFALFLVAYQQKRGHGHEYDLFIAQAVLQMLCTGRFKMALAMFQIYCITHPSIKMTPPYKTPLLNFMWLLTLSIPLKKVGYFSTLVEKYKKCLDRDPSFRVYLDKIGQIYFAVPPPPKPAIGGFFGNIIKGLMGTGQTAEATGGESSSAELERDVEEELLPVVDDQGFEAAARAANALSPSSTSPTQSPTEQGATASASSAPSVGLRSGPSRPSSSSSVPKRDIRDDDMELD